ncbi:hypothetical protein H4R34_001747 [Dimargaris verticillata]|uniref:ABC transporter domain-containing protein n=1 Tax=Dimargaris verticillata TaxID=2761393 RepID=A0A9W8EAM7_9FUNG|nr:hypothetical protein H4R34_001747 [Dimargaris verticillata]
MAVVSTPLPMLPVAMSAMLAMFIGLSLSYWWASTLAHTSMSPIALVVLGYRYHRTRQQLYQPSTGSLSHPPKGQYNPSLHRAIHQAVMVDDLHRTYVLALVLYELWVGLVVGAWGLPPSETPGLSVWYGLQLVSAAVWLGWYCMCWAYTVPNPRQALYLPSEYQASTQLVLDIWYYWALSLGGLTFVNEVGSYGMLRVASQPFVWSSYNLLAWGRVALVVLFNGYLRHLVQFADPLRSTSVDPQTLPNSPRLRFPWWQRVMRWCPDFLVPSTPNKPISAIEHDEPLSAGVGYNLFSQQVPWEALWQMWQRFPRAANWLIACTIGLALLMPLDLGVSRFKYHLNHQLNDAIRQQEPILALYLISQGGPWLLSEALLRSKAWLSHRISGHLNNEVAGPLYSQYLDQSIRYTRTHHSMHIALSNLQHNGVFGVLTTTLSSGVVAAIANFVWPLWFIAQHYDLRIVAFFAAYFIVYTTAYWVAIAYYHCTFLLQRRSTTIQSYIAKLLDHKMIKLVHRQSSKYYHLNQAVLLPLLGSSPMWKHPLAFSPSVVDSGLALVAKLAVMAFYVLCAPTSPTRLTELLAGLEILREFHNGVRQVLRLPTLLPSALNRAFQWLMEFSDPLDVPDPSKPMPVPVDSLGDIEFSHVDFGYTVDNLILRDVSFRVPAGCKVAVVGPSGCGKTTLLRLMARLYDVQGGEIRMGNHGIRDYSQYELRKHMGFVPQTVSFFSQSIHFNIAYGQLNQGRLGTRSEVVEGAKLTQIDQVIEQLSDGYDTELRAGTLSSGEQQRLGLARGLNRACQIMLLDETTANLDSKTEELVLQSAFSKLQKATVFMATHRMPILQTMDWAIVLDKGRVVQCGPIKELLNNPKGLLSRMANLYYCKTPDTNHCNLKPQCQK